MQTISNNKNVVLEIVSSLKDDGRTLVATRDSVVEQAQREKRADEERIYSEALNRLK